jgi:CDGSH-type Zn-finger protein
MRISVSENGPYVVSGDVPLVRVEIVTNEQGESVAWRETERIPAGEGYTLCRCGRSHAKPFCDGSHSGGGFDGTETASHSDYLERSTCIDGPGIKLRDARELCAEARYCDRFGGLWELVKRADDAESVDRVKEMAALCPSGRYTICDPDDTQHEPDLEPSIAIVDDPAMGVSGPLWVRGRIEIRGADGVPYEVRNRVTLCRCGHSANKPFCDGTHLSVGFRETEQAP